MNNTAVLIWTPALYFFVFQNTCDLCVPAQQAWERPQDQYIGRHKAGKTQLAGRKPPALNKSQFLHRHTQPHTGMASFPSLCLASAQEVSSPSALIRRVCMQALVMHVITLCGVFICLRFFPRRRERTRSPASCAVCSEEEHAFLKLNPEHTAALFLSR